MEILYSPLALLAAYH